MKKTIILLLVLLLAATSATAQTTRNDDSCDIANLPAATLLLPYFEVDINAPIGAARTTIFTLVNTTRQPQIASVTVWSDWAYPVFSFPIYLTGYDAQAINLYDIIGRGVLNATGANAPRGTRSLEANPRFLPGAANSCPTVPTLLPAPLIADVQRTLTSGVISLCQGSSDRVGSTKAAATGFITVDLVADCHLVTPNDPRFYDALLYDNVLTGDWQIVSPNQARGNFASGNPLVHIRAIPEGGNAGELTATNLPYTFYDRFTRPGRAKEDRRQPLPSGFVARFIQGGATGFNTNFLIWREGLAGADASCSSYLAQNSRIATTQVVRFDERENPTFITCSLLGSNCEDLVPTRLQASASVPSTATVFPPLTSGDVAGWMHMNLDHSPARTRPLQNWVVPLLEAEGRFSVAFDATALGNGCSPRVEGQP